MLIKPVRSPSIIVLGRDTALGEDAGLSLGLDHDPKVRHQPCLLGVPMMGREKTWIHHLCLLEVPWWGEISLEKSGCGGNEQKKCGKRWKWVKLGENTKMPYPQCARSIKTYSQTTMMPLVSQSMGL